MTQSEDRILGIFDEFFDNTEIKEELETTFDKKVADELIDTAIDNEELRASTRFSGKGLRNQIDNWTEILDRLKKPDIENKIDENLSKNIPELDKVTGLSSEAQNRVDNRLIQLIDKAEPEELVTLTAKEELSAKSQEDVNVELGEDINKFSREQLLDLNITNKGLKSVANRILKIPQSDLQNALESKGFVIDAKNIIRKGG